MKPGMSIACSILALLTVAALCAIMAYCIWRVTITDEMQRMNFPMEVQKDHMHRQG